MKNKLFSLSFLFITGILMHACASSSPKVSISPEEILKLDPQNKWDHSPDQIQTLCQEAMNQFKTRIDKLAHLPLEQSTFESVVLELEEAVDELSINSDLLGFYANMGVTKEVREAGLKCSDLQEEVLLEVYTRRDLFERLEKASVAQKFKTEEDEILMKRHQRYFADNGLKLVGEDFDKLQVILKSLISLKSKFSKNISEYHDELWVTKEELKGMNDDFINSLEHKEGLYKLTLNYTHATPVLNNVEIGKTRKALSEKFGRRGGKENLVLLKEILILRQKAAVLLGYPNHAALILKDRMSQTPEKAVAFLEDLAKGLTPLATQELAKLTELKKQIEPNEDPTLYAWDWRFYGQKYKKINFDIDEQILKEYFPFEKVTQGMFSIYETLFQVKFVELNHIKAWHDSVKTYAVLDPKTKNVLAYFYLDLFPRDGKYTHAAAWGLIKGKREAQNTYRKPLIAVIANFSPPLNNKPSLLRHSEVETYFHEFGHAVHQALTQSSYATLSGTAVLRDFVEAPSQMLEGWVWRKEGLDLMSGHYETGKPLPQEWVDKLVEVKLVNSGLENLRQIHLAQMDLTFHTLNDDAKDFDTTQINQALWEKYMQMPAPQEVYSEASFGHLMHYDAGYYGYLWSEVFAADMFSRFEKEGLLNVKTGLDYRRWILEKGGSAPPAALLEGFLGRKPTQEAFLKSVGLTPK